MILAGTSADKMQEIYTRLHRDSIYEPATIHDIPFEVLRESFLYLIKPFTTDLASPSLACRAWRVVSLDLMNSHYSFVYENRKIEPFICGLQLRSIVRLESYTIKHLSLDLTRVGADYIPFLARFTSPTISCLEISCRNIDSSKCYEALKVFFNQCDGILNLNLEYFDFGDDPAYITQIMKDGFIRLKHLNLVVCRGDIRMFVENSPILDLKNLYYESFREAAEDEDIIYLFASSYRTLTP
jgi:hypothetical protein